VEATLRPVSLKIRCPVCEITPVSHSPGSPVVPRRAQLRPVLQPLGDLRFEFPDRAGGKNRSRAMPSGKSFWPDNASSASCRSWGLSSIKPDDRSGEMCRGEKVGLLSVNSSAPLVFPQSACNAEGIDDAEALGERHAVLHVLRP
jgi:hypothetical protein